MAKVPDIVPVSDFRQGAASLLKRVREEKGPVFLTQRGRAAAVLLSVEEYERREQELEILRALSRGDQEIAAGSGFTLDEVLGEADALLGRPGP